MTLRMASSMPARIVQVLRDFLPAELGLIDTEEGEFTTPVPDQADYFEWDRPLITRFPAVCISLKRVRVLEILPAGFGDRLHGMYEVDVKAHVAIDAALADALALQKLCFRYAAGMVRVLCDQKNGLETAADPTRYAMIVRAREFSFGPQETQESGQQTRTAIVGVDVEQVEGR